jgi:hypothetical protein
MDVITRCPDGAVLMANLTRLYSICQYMIVSDKKVFHLNTLYAFFWDVSLGPTVTNTRLKQTNKHVYVGLIGHTRNS